MTINITSMDGDMLFAEKDSSFRILMGCLLSVLILSTLFGNTLVCAAVIRFRHLRSKVTNFFVISLAVSDLLVAMLVMPWKAVAEIAGFWPFGSFCNIWVAFDIMCSTASILNLCVISVDRYWAISSPFRYERKMTPKVAFIMISVAWTLSVLISFIPVQLNWHKAKTTSFFDLNITLQGTAMDNCDSSLNRTYAISSSLISFYIPVAIMIVTYTRIYRIAAKQIRRISALERAAVHAKNCQNSTGNGSSIDCQQPESSLKTSFKRETKVLKTLSVIMGVFVCCWLPFFILNCMVPFCDPSVSTSGAEPFCISSTTFDIFVWFGWANSSLNPIIYAFNADFRKAFSTLLGCYRLCPTSNNAIETVSINNNGAVVYSCQQEPKGSIPNECNLVYLIPHAIICPEEEVLKKEEESGLSKSLDKMSPAFSGILDYDAEVSLEKINPITHNGQPKT
ncbi:D(1A) dopamine receptor [Hyla sarda]|uniref:D(1A) dopamine receptor n=1 Tax=Hyla sarda TaxID=327740 RepID=UPI0024C2AF97|nr:D(1A) dopamine receptor [Hyla sarda]XP_056430835.1 D(1A) dopamine receptor [Hyla sarda]XP_056430836.1 D(1A) dopamine receptor [Hyla sarda]